MRSIASSAREVCGLRTGLMDFLCISSCVMAVCLGMAFNYLISSFILLRIQLHLLAYVQCSMSRICLNLLFNCLYDRVYLIILAEVESILQSYMI